MICEEVELNLCTSLAAEPDLVEEMENWMNSLIAN